MRSFLLRSFTAFLVLMTLLCTLMVWTTGASVVEQRQWLQAEAVVQNKPAVFHERQGSGRSRSFYCAEIVVLYSASTRAFESSVTKCYPAPLRHSFVERQVQEKFTPGSKLIIFYPPGNPTMATLQRASLDGTFYSALLMALLFGIITAMMLRLDTRKSTSPEG